MSTSEILIYKNPYGNIKIDVRLEDETVWLTQAQMAELFGKGRTTITEHIQNVFTEGELDEKMVCRNFRHTTQHGAIEGKTQETMAQQHTPMYMADWVQRLDSILQLNGRELLSHAGKISHEKAIEKSEEEFGKYKEVQKAIEKAENLKELENDIQKLPKPKI